MSQETNQANAPKNNSTWIYAAIIVVLLGACIYLFVSKRSVTQQNVEMAKVKDSISMDRTTIKGEYDAALARLDDLVSKNTALNNEINDKDGEIAKMKTELRGIMSKSNASKAELKRAKDLIAALNAKTKGYEERIAQLEGENKNLTESNVTLATQKDSISKETEKMKKVGSVLHASNIRLSAIHLKNGGKKEKETEKARRVDLLRMYFDIDENRIADDGNKELYIRITSPDGTLLSNAAYGSGITQTDKGESLNYTLQKEISLQKGQPVKDLTVDWHQDSDFKKGTYAIEIYNEGYKIGSGSVELH